MGRRCSGPELQRWAPGHAGRDRTHCRCDIQEAVGTAERGETKERRRTQYLPGFTRIHGVLCEEVCSVRGSCCRRLLRNNTATYPGDSDRGKIGGVVGRETLTLPSPGGREWTRRRRVG